MCTPIARVLVLCACVALGGAACAEGPWFITPRFAYFQPQTCVRCCEPRHDGHIASGSGPGARQYVSPISQRPLSTPNVHTAAHSMGPWSRVSPRTSSVQR